MDMHTIIGGAIAVVFCLAGIGVLFLFALHREDVAETRHEADRKLAIERRRQAGILTDGEREAALAARYNSIASGPQPRQSYKAHVRSRAEQRKAAVANHRRSSDSDSGSDINLIYAAQAFAADPAPSRHETPSHSHSTSHDTSSHSSHHSCSGSSDSGGGGSSCGSSSQ